MMARSGASHEWISARRAALAYARATFALGDQWPGDLPRIVSDILSDDRHAQNVLHEISSLLRREFHPDSGTLGRWLDERTELDRESR